MSPAILYNPEFGLSGKDRRDLMRRASSGWFRQPLNLLIFFGIVVGWMAGMVVLPRLLQRFGLSFRAASLINWLVFYPLMFVAFYSVFYRFRLARHIYYELRELGHDVCPECGYSLAEIPEVETSCPECGAVRVSIESAKVS